jgi:hypothetical protein
LGTIKDVEDRAIKKVGDGRFKEEPLKKVR